MLPETWLQVAATLAAVVPGFIYQVSRRRVAGPGPDERDVSIRVLQSIATSALFAGGYLVVLAPQLELYFRNPELLLSDPRTVGLWTLALVVGIPWSLARLVFYARTLRWVQVPVRGQVRRRPRLARAYDPTPTSWDFAFSNRGPGWVRVLTLDGRWLGGWFGYRSFASSWPEPQDLYIERGHQMEADGTFGAAISAPDGLFVRCSEIVMVDFISPKDDAEDDREEQ